MWHDFARLGGDNMAVNPGHDWNAEGTGHFSGTGDADILWQNDDGAVAIWFMNGTSFVGGGLLAPLGTLRL
jgi:serralysin